MTKYKLKNSNNQVYIVDVDDEPMPNDLVYSTVSTRVVNYTDPRHFSEGTALKVIATSEQINIDNLWEKYLDALAEKESNMDYLEFKEGYLKAKKETYWSNGDLIAAIAFGANWANDNQHINTPKSKYKKDVIAYYQQLKLSKIPECSVQIEMNEFYSKKDFIEGKDSLTYSPKLTDNKVTITKIIL